MNSAAIMHPERLPDLDGVAGCLTVGAGVLTPKGTVFAEDLRLGDKVLTKDLGYQRLTHVAMYTASLWSMGDGPMIRIGKDCLRDNTPSRTSYILARQLVALRHAMFDPLFGIKEVLAHAGDLTHLAGIDAVSDVPEITLIELGFQHPQLVFTDGMNVEVNRDQETSCRPVLSAQEAQLACGFLAPQLSAKSFDGVALH